MNITNSFSSKKKDYLTPTNLFFLLLSHLQISISPHESNVFEDSFGVDDKVVAEVATLTMVVMADHPLQQTLPNTTMLNAPLVKYAIRPNILRFNVAIDSTILTNLKHQEPFLQITLPKLHLQAQFVMSSKLDQILKIFCKSQMGQSQDWERRGARM